jgi:hypothetical protein
MIWKTRFFFRVKKSERAISWIISMFTFWLFIPFWNLSWTILYQGCYLAPLFSPFFWSPRGDSNPAPSGSQQKSLTARPTGTHVNAGWKHGPYYPKIKIIIFFNDVKTTESAQNPFKYFNIFLELLQCLLFWLFIPNLSGTVVKLFYIKAVI